MTVIMKRAADMKFTQPMLRQAQRGAVLFVALILLLILTLIGVTSMQTTTLQERMAGNIRDVNLAFQAAETALREGEEFLEQPVMPAFNGTNGLYESAGPGQTPIYKTISWTAGDSRALGSYGNGPASLEGVTSNPRYIIEELPPVTPVGGSLGSDNPGVVGMYRITARGTGGSDTAIVMLQTTYRR